MRSVFYAMYQLLFTITHSESFDKVRASFKIGLLLKQPGTKLNSPEPFNVGRQCQLTKTNSVE